METVFTWYSIYISSSKKTPRRENCVAHTLPLHLSLLEFASFMMNEWNKKMYGSILQIKTVFVSHSVKCFEYKVNSHNNILETKKLIYLQGQHEEADTIIAFHVKYVTGNVPVRSTNTYDLVIFPVLVVRSEG